MSNTSNIKEEPKTDKEEKQAPKKEVNDKKALSGTEDEEKQSMWEKAADTIAGDNKILASLLKMLLNPVVLITAGILGYVWFKNKQKKKEVDETKKNKKQKKKHTELKKLRKENETLINEMKTQKRKEQILNQETESVNGAEKIERKTYKPSPIKTQLKTAYLD